MKKPIAVVATALLAISLAGVGAQSASATNAISSYCSAHMWDDTAYMAAPSTALYCQMQWLAADYGYTGPINGTLGANSWLGIQKYLYYEGWGYTGPQNGIPGTNTYKAMQRAGNASGRWLTPSAVDGTLETRDWQAWAYAVYFRIGGN